MTATDGALIPDGTASVEGYERWVLRVCGLLAVPPPVDPRGEARSMRRGDRRRYLSLCRLLGVPVGTPIRLRGHVDPDAPWVRVATPDRAWVVPLPPRALEDETVNPWPYVTRGLRHQLAEEEAP